MSKEIEAQVLFINYSDVMSLIKKMGGELKFDWVKFRIAVFSPCLTIDEQKEKYGLIFTRVRDEGRGIITITTKFFHFLKCLFHLVNTKELFLNLQEYYQISFLLLKCI